MTQSPEYKRPPQARRFEGCYSRNARHGVGANEPPCIYSRPKTRHQCSTHGRRPAVNLRCHEDPTTFAVVLRSRVALYHTKRKSTGLGSSLHPCDEPNLGDIMDSPDHRCIPVGWPGFWLKEQGSVCFETFLSASQVPLWQLCYSRGWFDRRRRHGRGCRSRAR